MTNELTFESRSQVATKKFILRKYENLFFLDVCAFGDLWSEKFNTLEEVKKYLESEWDFKDLAFLDKVEKEEATV